MGRQPLNGTPMFRFLPAEVAEMEAAAREHTGSSLFPGSDVIEALAAKFSASPERAGKVVILPKQVLTWFHNRRYAPRTKENKLKGTTSTGKTVRPASGLRGASSSRVRPSAQGSASSGKKCTGSGPFMGQMMPSGSNMQKRSIPFQVTECVSVRCRDLVLCLQESEEFAFYCDASVLAIQRTKHDSTECFCKFLVCFEHDNSEEIVRLAKLRRRLDIDDRVQNFPAARAAYSADCRTQQTEANVNLASNENSGKADQKDEGQHKNTHDAIMASNSEHQELERASAATCNVSASEEQ